MAGCFTEIPGNPLLGSADLRKISPLLRQFRVPLVADDVVATPANVNLNGHADLIATSLTKFIVGTGGANHTSIAAVAKNSEVLNTNTFGVLKLTLHPTSYDWQFIPAAGSTFTDSGSAECH